MKYTAKYADNYRHISDEGNIYLLKEIEIYYTKN
jgi:hypothetical protein